MGQTIREAYLGLKAKLSDVVSDADREAKLILAHVTDYSGSPLFLELSLSVSQEKALKSIIKRRLALEPLQYILGEWEFMGLPIKVRKGALIPRQETEILCEHALKQAKANGYRTALDMCCGSGCIGLALNRLGGLEVTAVDISNSCLALSNENAKRLNAKLNLLAGSYFEPVLGRFELIVCNPPYLGAQDMASLQPELEYEPKRALFGGVDGLDAYRHIALKWKDHIALGGRLMLEIGKGQADAVETIFKSEAERILDYSGVVRVLSFRA